MIKYWKIILLSALFFGGGSVTLAANPTPQTVNEVFDRFIHINVTGLFPAMISIALVTFLAGVIKFVKAGDNEEARQAGRQVMIYGIVVLFVMMSFWGIVKLLTTSFFSDEPGLPNYLPSLSQ